MTKAVFGLVTTQEQARRVVDALLAANFSNEDISILCPDKTTERALKSDVFGNVESCSDSSCGTKIGSGIPEYEAKKYEAGLKEGNILMSVHTNSDDEVQKATDILKKQGAKDISSSKEKASSYY